MFYNLINNTRSKPFDALYKAQNAANELINAMFENGLLNQTVLTVDQSNRVTTEFKVIDLGQ